MEIKHLKIADFPTSLQFEISSLALVQTPPLPQCRVCVIVPVQNEAEILEQALTALLSQTDLSGRSLAPTFYEVIVLANNCNDESAAIAHRFAQQHPTFVLHVVEQTFPPEQANIGCVRRLLMDEAYRRLSSLGQKRGIIASTDGDSQVSPTWIVATCYEIAQGTDAVGGRILTDRAGRAALDPYARLCHLREVGYYSLIAELESYLDPDPCDRFPRHYQHYGASLAVTAEIYARAGGLPPVSTSEDVALYRALLRANVRFRHSPLVRVTTSARQTGRAQKGLADQLSQWAVMGQQQQPVWVESAEAIVTRFQARHHLRRLWSRILNGYQPTFKDIEAIATTLGVSPLWLMQELLRPHTVGALFEQVEQRQQEEGSWSRRWPPTKIEQAIQQLRLYRDRLKSQPATPNRPKTSHP
ncbi:glycosyltransferase [Phormidesmis priestleyi]